MYPLRSSRNSLRPLAYEIINNLWTVTTHLMEPPTSVPMPRALPLKATTDPSPPLLPPQVKGDTTEFFVWPNKLLFVSAHIIVCGVFVFAIMTAPASRRIWTR